MIEDNHVEYHITTTEGRDEKISSEEDRKSEVISCLTPCYGYFARICLSSRVERKNILVIMTEVMLVNCPYCVREKRAIS